MKNSILAVCAALVGGCGDDGGSGHVLWLVPNGSELAVKLVDETPTSTY